MQKITLLFILFFSIKTYSQDYQWTQVLGSTDTDYSRYLVSDKNGDIYVVGNFSGTIDLDPGNGTDNHTSAGDDDVFVVKLDNSGNLIWAKSFGGTDYDYANSIATDASDNIYICGNFTGTTDLNPSSSTASFTSNGSYDVYVVKLNSSGTYQWGETFGGTATDYARVISTDGSSNVYAVGYFDDTVDFDPGSGTDNHTSNGSTDIFITKLNSSGTFQWAETYGGSSSDKAYSIAIDSNEEVYVTGTFSDTVVFNQFTIMGGKKISNGSTDVFVLNLTSSGTFDWVKTYGGAAADYGISIDVDASTNLVVGGYFDDTVDFDPSSGTDSHTSNGDDDVFVQKLDTSGNFVWTQTFGGTKDEQPLAICTDALHNIYVAGFFKGTCDFDPGNGTASYTSNGGSNDDGFVLKLNENGQYKWVGVIGDSNSDYTSFVMIDASNDIYTCGHFKNTVDFDPSSNTDSYSSNGGYSDVYISKFSSCQNASNSIAASSCDAYLSPSGNYTWDSTGTYTDTLQIAFGCDSIITISLTIETVDTSVSQIGNSLSANSSGSSYQWLNCDSSYAVISGETNQSFEPNISGNYAVIVTQNGCSDTSSCNAISISSDIKEVDFRNVISLYPNPTSGDLHIVLPDSYYPIEVEIRNQLDQLILSQYLKNSQESTLKINAPDGICFLNVKNKSGENSILKILRE